MGRPTKMVSTTISKLKEAFLMGCTDSEACLYADICRDTLYEYQINHPEFSDQKEVWKSNPILKARQTIFESLNKHTVAMWYLSRKAKIEFGTQREEQEQERELILTWSE